MSTKTFGPGELIVAEGTYGNHTFLIKSGQVLICKETVRLGRIPITSLSEGEVFGSMLQEGDGMHAASAIAQTCVTVELIEQGDMETYLNQTPAIVKSVLNTLGKRLTLATEENAFFRFHESSRSVNPIARMLGV